MSKHVILPGSLRARKDSDKLAAALDTISEILLDESLSAADVHDCVGQELLRLGYRKA